MEFYKFGKNLEESTTEASSNNNQKTKITERAKEFLVKAGRSTERSRFSPSIRRYWTKVIKKENKP